MIMLQTKCIGLKFLGVMLNGKRDDQEHIATTVRTEFECDFLGSADTLIGQQNSRQYLSMTL